MNPAFHPAFWACIGAIGLPVATMAAGPRLPVDPGLVVSTYLGGDGRESVRAVAVDGQGHVFVLGNTAFGSLEPGSAPLIRHTVASFLDTSPDVFLVKYAPDTRTVEYFVTLGGSLRDDALSVAVDEMGRPVVLLRTESDDFPTRHPLQASLRGPSDLAIVKLSADGREVIFSTYFGGNDHEIWMDGGVGLALDGDDHIHLAGSTYSTDFPVTPGALQPTPGSGLPNGFIARLSADGSRLLYSTYLGGDGNERCQALAVWPDGRTYVAGTTTSSNFPLVSPLNGMRGVVEGAVDPGVLFLARLDPTGTTLEFSTFLIGGGSVHAMALTPRGGVVLAGRSSGGLTVTPNALQRAVAGGFLLELDPELSAIAYSTHLGATTTALALDADAAGNLAITGTTQPGSLVTTHDSFASDNPLLRGAEAFALKLDADRRPVYSVRLGGAGTDEGRGIALLPDGDVVVAGFTQSFDFPTLNATRTFPIGDEGFVTRITEVPSQSGGGDPGTGPMVTQRYSDRGAANLPRRFYRLRELRP